MTYPTKNKAPHPALLPVDLRVSQGEFVTVVGPSGCGKSTLLKIIGGLVVRSTGTVTISGHPIDGPSEDAGIVFQSPVLLPRLTIAETVALPLKIRGVRSAERLARAAELLRLVSLSGYENQYPRELSGGMQQRVGIARALAHEPDTLLMDELFGALDAMTRDQMSLQLLHIWGEFKKTIVFVTHSIPEAVICTDRVVVMTAGPGSIADILTIDLPQPRTLEMINTPEFGSPGRARFPSCSVASPIRPGKSSRTRSPPSAVCRTISSTEHLARTWPTDSAPTAGDIVLRDASADRIDLSPRVAIFDVWMKYGDVVNTSEAIDYFTTV